MAAEPSAKVAQVLNGIAFPERRVSAGRDLSSTTQLRIERARLLAAAGLPDLADSELRFGARNDGQPHLLAMELARTAPSAHLGLRYMKSFAPDYLSTPFEQMPRRFWELLFPVPYQKDLVSNAKLQNLDAYIVAALIRQESEFNPGGHLAKERLWPHADHAGHRQATGAQQRCPPLPHLHALPAGHQLAAR